ncbi:pectate lyase [Xanthomonas campestris pv. raphani]|uniref:pectate lyase family protein n=1 Tax=Xanthomonas campestris TaxID=339 RepID=UPI00096D8B0C|nr:pectate lyase [Xanthomonas campestris]MCF8826279.1 pectate lyase [Xanthomonas campestris pv. raphani]QLC69693.1 pectate lyase [Xanthomonas campestris pv. raphani]
MLRFSNKGPYLSISTISLFLALFIAQVGITKAATGGFSSASISSETAITVATLAELTAALNAKHHHIIIGGNIYGGPKLTTLNFSSTDWNNTTIEGAPGGRAVLQNIQLKFSGEKLPAGENIQNVVIRNISFAGNIGDLQSLPYQVKGTSNNIGINYMGVSLRRTSNAWIDHCNFYDMSDDLLLVSMSSDYITLSYNHFYFSNSWVTMNPDPVWSWVDKSYHDLANERLAILVGYNKNDSYIYGGNKLHVTLHHNWFGPNLAGRPLLRGWVHAYNNYFDNSTLPNGTRTAADGRRYGKQQYNALQIGSGSIIFSESNYFYKTNVSNHIRLESSGDIYNFHEKKNVYDATTGDSATGSTFNNAPVKYSYEPDDAARVPGIVRSNAGPH